MQRRILIVSDIHYAGPAEQGRAYHEIRVIANPALRLLARGYRHYIWLREPFCHNHLLDHFIQRAGSADLVVANGDFSCDTAFVGVSDDASFASARECLEKLRGRFGDQFHATLGDHELGKMSLFGGCGGLRLASWHRAERELRLCPYWKLDLGNYALIGVVSSLLALPVYEPETLPEERAQWRALREAHLRQIREGFGDLRPGHKVLLFCHDPTALPFLWEEAVVRQKIGQIERTIIGHLHSNLILWKSRILSGLPTIGFLGNTIRRMSSALSQARYWRPFNVLLCPSLAGIELRKDGGFYEVDLSDDTTGSARFVFHRMRR